MSESEGKLIRQQIFGKSCGFYDTLVRQNSIKVMPEAFQFGIQRQQRWSIVSFTSYKNSDSLVRVWWGTLTPRITCGHQWITYINES